MKRRGGEGDDAKQQHQRRVDGRGETHRRDEAPGPLRRRERPNAKIIGPNGFERTRRPAARRPPDIGAQKNEFGNRRDGHAEIQEQERPNIGGDHADQKTYDQRAYDNQRASSDALR